jgi:hypothetical protein
MEVNEMKRLVKDTMFCKKLLLKSTITEKLQIKTTGTCILGAGVSIYL